MVSITEDQEPCIKPHPYTIHKCMILPHLPVHQYTHYANVSSTGARLHITCPQSLTVRSLIYNLYPVGRALISTAFSLP